MSIIENLSELSIQYFALVRQLSAKFELTLSQTLILLSIPFDGLTISDLSDKLGIDISTMTRNIQRIEKKKPREARRSRQCENGCFRQRVIRKDSSRG